MIRDLGLKIDPQRAKNIGRTLFHKYDTSRNGVLEPKQCYEVFSDYCYRILNINNPPTMEQAQSMHKVLDFNQDRRVTEADFQNLAVKFLCQQGNNRLASSYIEQPHTHQSTTSTYKSTRGPKTLTNKARSRLDVIQRLFRQFDQDQNGYLTEQEIPSILRQTYKQMGYPKYTPSSEDVKSYMRLVDTNRDGKVTLEEFQTLVLRSLEKAGIEIYQN